MSYSVERARSAADARGRRGTRPRPPYFYQCFCFFFNDTATTEIYTLSLHDALPILLAPARHRPAAAAAPAVLPSRALTRSEEHTSELQSRENLVCRLLLEKKKY